jgi:hypothetical protein
MAQLTWGTEPGFVDLPDSNLAANQPLTSYALQAMNNNSKAAAVRPETFYGWYRDGETVLLPVSPVDGHQYTREELEYEIAAWDARGPASGALNGVQARPARANTNAAPGTLYDMWFAVEEKNEANPGLVHCYVSYWTGSAENQTNSGMVKVRIIATRLSG